MTERGSQWMVKMFGSGAGFTEAQQEDQASKLAPGIATVDQMLDIPISEA